VADRPEVGGDPDVGTTGHEWDGIVEADNPLPRWWLWVLLATVVWAVGYWIVMPSWPLVSGYTKGLLGYSQRATVADKVAAAQAARAAIAERLMATPIEKASTEPDLLEFAMAGGRSAFLVNCTPCHGTGGAGAPGYPNLNDDDWLWGGSLEAIQDTITYGIRSENDNARFNQMPAFLADDILDAGQVEDVAEYVLSLSGRADDQAAAERGAQLFADWCASCHGEQGEGNTELGAPDLRDAIWLYGGDKATIVETISNSRGGVMPAWEGRLSPVTIKQLAIYVHALGGGE
jgi:cytochrome c oxidase cbb3-type subunit 3